MSPIRTPAITTGEPIARWEPSRNRAYVVNPPPIFWSGTRDRISRTTSPNTEIVSPMLTRRESQRTPALYPTRSPSGPISRRAGGSSACRASGATA